MNDLSHILRSALTDIQEKKFDGPHFPERPENIKSIRARYNLSQRELAARIGVSVDTIKSWESGRRKPSSLALKAASAALIGLMD